MEPEKRCRIGTGLRADLPIMLNGGFPDGRALLWSANANGPHLVSSPLAGTF